MEVYRTWAVLQTNFRASGVNPTTPKPENCLNCENAMPNGTPQCDPEKRSAIRKKLLAGSLVSGKCAKISSNIVADRIENHENCRDQRARMVGLDSLPD